MKPLNQMTSADVLNFIKGIDKKTWVKIAACSVGGILVFMFLVWPAWISRLEVRGRVKDLKQQVTTTQNLLLRKPQLIQDKEKFFKFSQEVKGRMFEPGEASLLLGIVSKMAQETKVSIVSSTPKKFEEKFPAPFDTQYDASAYDFNVEGAYHELGEFVSKLESYNKVLRVQSFHLTPQEKASDKHVAALTLTAVAAKQGAPK